MGSLGPRHPCLATLLRTYPRGFPWGCYLKLSLYGTKQRQGVDFYDIPSSRGILFRTVVRLRGDDFIYARG